MVPPRNWSEITLQRQKEQTARYFPVRALLVGILYALMCLARRALHRWLGRSGRSWPVVVLRTDRVRFVGWADEDPAPQPHRQDPDPPPTLSWTVQMVR